MDLNKDEMRVLYVTSQWPTSTFPHHSPFVREEVEALRDRGVKVDVYHYKGSWNPINYIQPILGFHRQLRQHHYDLVHARFGQCGLVAASQWWLPIVIRFGGSDLIGWENAGREPIASKYLTTVSRLVAKRASYIILPNAELAKYLQVNQDYSIIPSGINLDLFYPIDKQECRNRLGLPLMKKLILFAADPKRFIKRFDLAEVAVEIVKKWLDDVEMIVTANVPHDQMPLYMNACDVLVLTSQHEGSPNVVKEALACNLPVVSVDVGDVRIRIADLEGCHIVDTALPEYIADAIVKTLKSQRPEQLRDTVLELSTRKMSQKTIEVYQSLLSHELRSN